MHDFMNSSLPVLSVHAPGIDETTIAHVYLPDFLKLYSAASGDQRKRRETVSFQLLLKDSKK